MLQQVVGRTHKCFDRLGSAEIAEDKGHRVLEHVQPGILQASSGRLEVGELNLMS